jgi:PAS domain S-box-containing protein
VTSSRNELDNPSRVAALKRLNRLDSRAVEYFDRLTRLAQQMLAVPISLFSLIDDTRQHFKSSLGLSDALVKAGGLPLSHSFCQHVITSGKPLVVSDASKHALVKDNPSALEYGFVAYAGVPVLSAEGYAVGVFCVIDQRPRVWRMEEVKLLGDLVKMLGPLRSGTETQMAEAKLRRALDQVARQQFALDQHAIVAMTDLKGTITYANDKFCELSGYTREELLGQNHRIIKSGVHPPEYFRELYETISQRKVWHGEFCNRAKDGHHYWVYSTIAPFIDQDGNLEQYVAIHSDITALKQMTEDLRFSHERMGSIIAALTDGLVVRDSFGRVLNANPAAERILGVKCEQLFGTTYSENHLRVIHEDGRPFPCETHPFMHTLRTGEPKRDVIMGLCRPDDSLVWISVNTQPIRNNLGQIVSVVSSFTDITHRLQADRALRDSEALLRAFVEHAPAAVAMFDRDMRYLVASRQWYTDYHILHHDIIGKSHYEVFPEIPERWKEVHRRCMEGEIVHSDADIFLRASGSKQWLSYELRPWHRMDGSIGGIVMFTCDITLLKLAEAERTLLEQKLTETQKLESLGVLAGGIAHDFNNILTGIVANNSLALTELPIDSPVREHLMEIRAASQRATDLTRQMLAYSGRGRFVIQKLDLSQVVEETAQLLNISISKKVSLAFDLARKLPPVEVDASQISQIIMNLVINASEAVGDQPGGITIRTGLMQADKEYLNKTEIAAPPPAGEYVFLEVQDTGCGISTENLKRIFEPFFTTKFTGRGLGLAAVLGIVRSHKGTLSLSSEPGKGTTFRVLLPCAAGTYDTPTHSPFSDETNSGSGTILVIDDEDAVRGVLGRILRTLGYEVVLARDGQEGVDQFMADPGGFVLVLLDLTMPKLDGAQVSSEIRRVNPTVPIVLMSGYSEQEATAHFSGKGLAGFIQKPFDLAALRGALTTALAGANAPHSA